MSLLGFSISALSLVWGEEVDCYIEGTLCYKVAEKRTDYIKGELLLLLDKGFSKRKYQALLKKNGLAELDMVAIESLEKNLIRASTNGKSALVLEKKINRTDSGVVASTNNIYDLNGITTKSLQADLYPKSLTGAQEALKYSKGKGILIGMIDGPVDLLHPSFRGRVEQRSLVGAYPRSFAHLLHGTTIAGVLVSKHEAIGIAPEARVFSITAFTKKTNKPFSSSSALIAQAIDIAIQKNVDILNLSFAGGSDGLVKKLINKAISKGVLVVASCGNESSNKPRFPAAIEDVIAVTAVDSLRKVYGKANTGGYIDVAAPGVSILSTAPGGRYELSTGTSFAAANVSGSLALLLAKRKKINKNLLIDTATDLGDEAFGYGLINVLQALKQIQ